MPICRSCRAEITWANTVAGKLMPLDADPTSDGNVILSVTSPVVATVLGPLELELLDGDVPRFTPHFVTCPEADTWRH